MPGFLTHHANDRLLDLIFGRAPICPPPVWHLGLSLEEADRSGSYYEPAGGGYARAEVKNDFLHFPPAARGRKANAVGLRFPRPTADWGTVRSVFVADAPRGGTVIAMADLGKPFPVRAGRWGPVILPGSLNFRHY